ncbi:hypothetical protein FB547_1095 [Variovorax beijingensis]|uniref:Helix-turn-helix domain-containing protein n=1 Tax=Variovorax beijingensis TaxID=2496117 RepID=A0A561BF05_9BURK|nr:helix-turn-helix domain-containing protein [Variovorax beijingensis]TWD77471.1 hypothetical protein FB547_1095 [Variovorax beijingensis]
MSILVMSRVWQESSHSGAHLLMMLAIADFADDQGRAYPSVSTLAQKCRVKPRAANYSLADLKESGELEIKIGRGPRGANLYRIALDRLGAGREDRRPLQHVAPMQPGAPLQSIAPPQCAAPLQPGAQTPATGCMFPLHPVAPKPSLNHQEPSVEATASVGSGLPPCQTQALPDCPHLRMIDLFAKHLPELPQPRPELWQGKNAEAMRARWKWVMTAKRTNGERYATTANEALDWFDRFFQNVAGSAFLTGRNGKWACNLGWLMKADNFTKVVQGNYENKEAA